MQLNTARTLVCLAALPVLLAALSFLTATQLLQYKAVSPDGRTSVEVTTSFILLHGYLTVTLRTPDETRLLLETRDFDDIVYFAHAEWTSDSRYLGVLVSLPQQYCLGWDGQARRTVNCDLVRPLIRQGIRAKYPVPASLDPFCWADSSEANLLFTASVHGTSRFPPPPRLCWTPSPITIPDRSRVPPLGAPKRPEPAPRR